MHSSYIITILAACTASVASAAQCRAGYAKAGNDEGVKCFQVKCDTALRGGVYITTKPGRNIRECVNKCYNYYECESVAFEEKKGLCHLFDGNPRVHNFSGFDTATMLDSVDKCF